MKKIPTLFVRDETDRRYITDELAPGCEWVLAGEGVATRKYDGTCVMFDGSRWWGRREVKPGKPPPEGWTEVEVDDTTGKRVGWEPIDQASFAKVHADALRGADRSREFSPGTYELCGPKVNGNPEGFDQHRLIPHGEAERYDALSAPSGYDELRAALPALPWEGIVWHHQDGRMAKLKKRDLRLGAPA